MYAKINYIPILVCLSLFGLLGSCAKTAHEEKATEDLQLSPEIRARLDSLNAEMEIPEGLTDKERVTYIENHVLTTPISAAELLALQPIHTLDPSERYWMYISESEWEKIRLMNRFMRMQYVALGDPMDEMRWVEATQAILDEYAVPLGITQEQAVDSLLSASEYLCCGTQYEINQCTFVMSSVEYYKTLAAYKAFMERSPKDLQPLLQEEYAAWNKLNKARHNVYVNIIRYGDHYSALPMELEGMYAAYAEKRRQMLDLEKDILSLGEKYALQHPVVRTADWEQYLQALQNKCADDDASAIVQKLDETVSAWISIRQQIAKRLPSSAATSYDNVTADYHWAIVHAEERVPEMYD